MNLKSIFSVVALSALMVGCSSDDLTNEPGAVETPTSGETMTGYLNVNINLPTVSATGARALDQSNDQFDDGLASEYAVKSAHLVIFDTDNEATAKVVGVFSFTDLKPWNTDASTTDNITSSAESVIKVQVTKSDKNLGALVVLNDPAAKTHFIKDLPFQKLFSNNPVTIGEVNYNPIVNLATMKNSDGFFMTNAPLYNGTTAKTLVSILPSSICNSPQEAQQSPAINVYVERAVAKVNVTTSETLTNDITINTSTTENNTVKNSEVTYKATVSAWGLDITNKKSYLVRNVSAFDTWKGYGKGARFYSESSNRIYWAIDPNYTDGSAEDAYITANFNKISESDIKNTTALSSATYILENTFDVANQLRDRTTRAIIKASFAPEGQDPKTFYTIGSANTIYTKEGMQAFIKGLAVNLLEGKNDASLYTFAPSTSVSNAAGKHTIGAEDIKYNNTVLTPDEVNKLNDAIGNINTYLNGVCYYVARIQHFGDMYTKWDPGDPTYGADATTAANDYLGRYGAVRNNWYELQISEIKNLGNPTIPTAPDTPDDEDYYYISFKVNIHSWAKRVQNVIL